MTKILIITPDIHRLGGVSNHYLGLSTHWTFDIEYVFYGKRNDRTSTFKTLLLYPLDYIRTFIKLIAGDIDVVVVNPSLRKAQLLRDGLFLLLARMCRKPVVTFIHGFDENLAEKFVHNSGAFQWCYGKSMFIYTLYSGYRERLIAAGLKCPIVLTTTKVATEMLDGLCLLPKKKVRNLLFVARINREKGIYTTLDVFSLLKSQYPYLNLTICGDGPELENAQSYAMKKEIKDVFFRGNLIGTDLRKEYMQGDVYILPTTHGEGMATTVLEAMAFGLPVISRPNGGVVDFFTENMGYLIDSLDPKDYVSAIETLIDSPHLMERMSITNMKYAKEHFMADKVANKFESDILKYMNGQSKA